MWQTDNRNYQIDITNTFEIKLAAIAYHKSQIGDFAASEFTNFVKDMALSAGKGTEYKYAEAFSRVEVLQRL
jgi:LmbE family N-acetylglucosaminyl deacetylase